MLPDSVDIVFPDTAEEVGEILRSESDARVISGGTDLVPKLKRGVFDPGLLVSLEYLEGLDEIRRGDGEVVIGARTRLVDLAGASEFEEDSAIRTAARLVASPAIRHRGTVGGNLLQDTRCQKYDRSELWREGLGGCLKCDGDVCRVAPGSDTCLAACCSDLAPALVVHGARVRLLGRQSRTVPLEELYDRDGADHLQLGDDELLTELIVPDNDVRSRYDKLRARAAIDFPELGVAVAERSTADGPARLRAALSGIEPTVPVWETELDDDDEVSSFVEEVYKEARPMDSAHFGPLYRKRCIRPYLRRLLEEVR